MVRVHLKNEKIQQLIPYWEKYIEDKLRYHETGEKLPYDYSTNYAHIVITKVICIDNTFLSIELAKDYLSEVLVSEQSEIYEKYAYHIENILLRLSKIKDLSYQLVGAALLLPEAELLSLRCKRLVDKKLSQYEQYKGLRLFLSNVVNEVEQWSAIRNDIAHNENYSSEYYNLWATLELVKSKAKKREDFENAEQLVFYKDLEIKKTCKSLDKSIRNLHYALDKLVSESGYFACFIIENVTSSLNNDNKDSLAGAL